MEERIRQIQAFQAVCANPGKAAPAGSRPGAAMTATDEDALGAY